MNTDQHAARASETQRFLTLFLLLFFFSWLISAELLLLPNTPKGPRQFLSLILCNTEHIAFAIISSTMLISLAKLGTPRILLVVFSFALGFPLIINRAFYQIFYDHLSFSAFEQDINVSAIVGSFYGEAGPIDYANLSILLLLQYPTSRLLTIKNSSHFTGKTHPRDVVAFLVIFTACSFLYGRFYATGNTHHNPWVRVALEVIRSGDIPATVLAADSEQTSLEEIYQPIWADDTISQIESSPNTGQAKKNIILIVLESIGSIQLFSGGRIEKDTTPFLAGIRNKTTLFNSIYVYYPATTRSHVPIQTGGISFTYAPTSQLKTKYNGPSLASSFRSEKYRTSLFSAQTLDFGNLDELYNQMNLDFVFDPTNEGAEFIEENKVHSWGVHETSVVPKMIKWIDEQGNQPFFTQFLTVSSHHPYGYENDKTDDKRPSNIERYRKSLRYADSVIETIWNELNQRQLLKNTVIYITGDHGQAFGDRHSKNFTHRNFLYEENIKSFLLRIDNNQEHEIVIDRSGSVADIAPTIVADALTRAAEKKFLGQDLFSPSYQKRLHFFHKHQQPMQWGLIDGEWKFIGNQSNPQSAELYNLKTDPTEQINLSSSHQERLTKYQERSSQWLAGMQAEFNKYVNSNANNLSLSAKDLSEKGPKTIRTGLQINGQFIPKDTFHPDEDISSQIFRIPDQGSHEYTYSWVCPDGRTFTSKRTVDSDTDWVYKDLDLEFSMPEGQWHLNVDNHEGKFLSHSFTVSRTEKLLDPRFRAMGPRTVTFAGATDKAQTTTPVFHPEEDIMLITSGVPYFRDSNIDLFWIAPSGETSRQVYVAKPKQSRWIISAPNSLPLDEGRWEVEIKSEKRILVNGRFEISARSPLRRKKEFNLKPKDSSRKTSAIAASDIANIVIIDDQINKAHMQAYGYHRENMPAVQEDINEGKWIVFQGFHNTSKSPHAHPALGLEQIPIQHDHATVFEILNQSGVKTVFMSDDTDHYGDRVLSQIADRHESIEDLPLEKITEKIAYHLAETRDSGMLLVVHLGKTPKCPAGPYRGALPEGHFGRNSNTPELAKRVNCHDNRMLEIDALLASITGLDGFKRNPVGLWYLAENTDHIFEKIGHNEENLSNKIRDLPLMYQPSAVLRDRHRLIYSNLQKNRSGAYHSRTATNTLLGMHNAKANQYNPVHDISSSFFKEVDFGKGVNPNDETISKRNQQENVAMLEAGKLGSRMVPHRCNSLGKVSQVIHSNIRSAELDLYFFTEDGVGGYFEIGNDNDTMSGLTLEELLKKMPGNTEKLWLDIKNITPKNIYAIADHLDELDSAYSLRPKAIIESQIESDEYRVLSDRGYYTSYYLPTSVYMNLVRAKDQRPLREWAMKIATQTEKQRVKSISFNSDMYQFVKDMIEPALKEPVDYHTWDMSLQSRKEDFIETLFSKKYFHDDRIKTILYAFYSEYTL